MSRNSCSIASNFAANRGAFSQRELVMIYSEVPKVNRFFTSNNAGRISDSASGNATVLLSPDALRLSGLQTCDDTPVTPGKVFDDLDIAVADVGQQRPRSFSLVVTALKE